jgi:NADH-quinone oxidoreductase subunit J
MTELFFGYFALAIVALSLAVVTAKHPMHCVLSMLILFLHIAGLYVLLNAEFLAVVQVIVYAGAILVLFLFAIMVLNVKEELKLEIFIGSWPVAVAAGLALFTMLFATFRSITIPAGGRATVDYIRTVTHSRALGREIFVNYILPFEVVSIILLVAIIGAIVLAKKKLKE